MVDEESLTGRNAYLMELDPLYADVIVTRWENLTGKKAEREPNGHMTRITYVPFVSDSHFERAVRLRAVNQNIEPNHNAIPGYGVNSSPDRIRRITDTTAIPAAAALRYMQYLRESRNPKKTAARNNTLANAPDKQALQNRTSCAAMERLGKKMNDPYVAIHPNGSPPS